MRKLGKHLVDEETGEILATSTSPTAEEVVPIYNAVKGAPYFKTPWNHDTDAESLRTATTCSDPSLTKQEFKDETDINVILDRFMKTKELPPMALPEHFLDLSGRKTYFEMASQVAEANEKFYLLDADTRAQFQNDPTKWADAVVSATEHGDRKALREMGIDVPDEPAEPRDPPTGTPAVAPVEKPPEAAKTP